MLGSYPQDKNISLGLEHEIMVWATITFNRISFQTSIEFGMNLKKSATRNKQREILFVTTNFIWAMITVWQVNFLLHYAMKDLDEIVSFKFSRNKNRQSLV